MSTLTLSLPPSTSHSLTIQLYASYLKKNASEGNAALNITSASSPIPSLAHTSAQQQVDSTSGTFSILQCLQKHLKDTNDTLRLAAPLDRANAYAYTQLTVADVRANLSRFNNEFLRFKTFALGNTLSIADMHLFTLLTQCQDAWLQNDAYVSIKRYYNHIKNLDAWDKEEVKKILGNVPEIGTKVAPFKFNPVPAIHEKPAPAVAPTPAKGGAEKKGAPAKGGAEQQKGGADKKGAAADKKGAEQQKPGAPAKGEQPAAAAGAKKEKKEKKAKPQPKAQAISPNCIDIRVGRIVEAKMHPDAEKLYIEQIDIGEAKPRTIVSGLFQKIPLKKLQGSLCLVMVNLKPATMVGVESNGMLLSAVSADGKFDTLLVPEGTPVGERVMFTGSGKDEPEKQVNTKKLKKYLPSFKTNDKGQVVYDDFICRTSKGVVMSPFQNGLVA